MRYFNLVLTAAVLFIGCASTESGPSTSVESEGFKPFLSARGENFDPPGRVFRMDPDGRIFGVTQLKIPYQTVPEILYKLKYTSEISFDEVLQTIGVAATELPVNVTADLKYKRLFETESVTGQREISDDDVVDKAFSENFPKIIVREDNKYFIIRETIKTDNLCFRSNKSWLTNLGIETEFKKAVESKAKLNWSSEREFSLEKKFDKPMRIWYKAESLAVYQAIGAGPGKFFIIERTGNVAPTSFMVPSAAIGQNDVP